MASSRKVELAAPSEPRETTSIVFEWPLRGLKQMFENSKTDHKSKVIKSAPFGGGRWTVLFYAQSGIDQFCSLYLNAEPLPHERVHPLLVGGSPSMDQSRDSQATSSKSKSDANLEEKWSRKGLFRFTFNIQTMDDKTNLGTKEAHDHAFSHKTSNWGWAQFAKRDHVYYKNAEVMRDDGFLISVTITSSPEKPKIAKPITHTVPPVLVQAMGSLLDDPEHSDVVFYLYPRRKSKGRVAKADIKKVYAIRKILAARSEYFRDMFESGFQEAEAEESSSEDEATTQGEESKGRLKRIAHTPAHPQRAHHAAAKAEQVKKNRDSDDDDEMDQHDAGRDDEEDDDEFEDDNAIMEDSDEDSEVIQSSPPRGDYEGNSMTQGTRLEDDPNEDEEAGSEDEQEEENEEEEEDDESSPVAQAAEDAVESEEEGDGEATGDDAYTIAATSTSPRFVTTEIRHPGRRQSSGTYVDANSNQMTEMNRLNDLTRSKESLVRTCIANGEEIPVVEHLAAAATASPHQKRSSTSSPALSIATKGSYGSKRDRVLVNEANTVKTREVTPKRPSNIHRRKRRKVAIVDSAYPTFKALLFFLYTDTIEFAPLTSSFLPSDVAADDAPSTASSSGALFSRRRGKEPAGQYVEEMQKARKKRKSVIESHLIGFPDKPSPCSAKAMYRLADKLDIPDLKQRAQEHIAMSLSIQNIVWEVFSGFTAHYPDICKMETDFLLKHWPQVKRINAMKSIFLRHSAHPGLAQVWPYLLECLEYRRPEVDDVEESSL